MNIYVFLLLLFLHGQGHEEAYRCDIQSLFKGSKENNGSYFKFVANEVNSTELLLLFVDVPLIITHYYTAKLEARNSEQ